MINQIRTKLLEGGNIDFSEAMHLIEYNDLETILGLADEVRRKYRGNRIDLCTIMNAKSGKCTENCKYCAQSAHYNTGIDEYGIVAVEDAVAQAKENERYGVHRFSLVTSGRGIEDDDFEKVIDIYKAVGNATSLKLCASHGIISKDKAVRLKEAGVSMYHHNVETSREYFSKICDTHTYQDRLDTIQNVMDAGIDVCCGGIIGMGESRLDRIKMAFEIRNLDVKSVPINVLNPVAGTPLGEITQLTPNEILLYMAMFRLIIPSGSIRFAGGRSALGEFQRKGLESGVDAMLVGNYLTTVGNKIEQDLSMVRELGREV